MDKEITIRASIKLSDDTLLSIYHEVDNHTILKMTPWQNGVGHGTTLMNREQVIDLVEALQNWLAASKWAERFSEINQ